MLRRSVARHRAYARDCTPPAATEAVVGRPVTEQGGETSTRVASDVAGEARTEIVCRCEAKRASGMVLPTRLSGSCHHRCEAHTAQADSAEPRLVARAKHSRLAVRCISATPLFGRRASWHFGRVAALTTPDPHVGLDSACFGHQQLGWAFRDQANLKDRAK
jgi:hypothetical protein